MRLRGRKGIREALEEQPELIVLNPKDYRGRWAELFGRDKPIHAELGMGKGQFISEWSRRSPEVNYIGVDMYDELLRRAGEKARRSREEDGSGDISNLRLALFNIEKIDEVFADGELERIYLNFSDPWPKARHARRRLTHSSFVDRYRKILNDRGEIHFKTDSRSLFEFSLNSFAEMGLRMRNISLDLHHDGVRDDLVLTEYESKFVGKGMPIYRCEVIIGKQALSNYAETLAARDRENAAADDGAEETED